MGSRAELHDRDMGCYAEDRLGPMQEDEPVARPGAPEAVVACNISLIRCCIGSLQTPWLTTCLERCVVETATREEPRAESGRDLHSSTSALRVFASRRREVRRHPALPRGPKRACPDGLGLRGPLPGAPRGEPQPPSSLLTRFCILLASF